MNINTKNDKETVHISNSNFLCDVVHYLKTRVCKAYTLPEGKYWLLETETLKRKDKCLYSTCSREGSMQKQRLGIYSEGEAAGVSMLEALL